MIRWLEKHSRISWAITVLIAVFIFYVSSLEFPTVPGPGNPSTKASFYHIIIFFIFAAFLLISLVKGKKEDLIFLGVIIASGYAFLDEFHQLFVPGRYGSLGDVMLDFIGISAAAMGYFVVVRARKE